VTTERSLGSTPFLPPDAFLGGPFIPKSGQTNTGGRATYRGYIVFTNLDRELVRQIVPPTLELAENRVSPGVHPIMYIYGFPEDTSWIIDGETYLEGTNYEETMLLVPFVHGPDGSLWHTHVVRMYLTNAVAIWIGNEYFAYAKRPGKFQSTDIDRTTAFQMAAYDNNNTKKFRTEIAFTGGWRPSADAETSIPNYRAIQTMLAMPLVGQRSCCRALVCSYFEMDYTKTIVAPVTSFHEFVHPFVPEMSTSWMNQGRLSSVVNGAVAVERLEWLIDEHPLNACYF